jgi:exosortase/archaeosortase family protein
VNSVRAAGRIPAAPTTRIAGLSRGGAFAAAGILAALNAQADHIILDLSWQAPLDAVLSLGGVSAVVWAAMVAAWKIGGEDRRPLRGYSDSAVLGAVVILSFLPISYAAQAGLLLCAIYLLLTAGGRNGAEQRTAFVLLALTGPLIWGRLLLRLFERPILALDAHLVAAAIGSRVDGNIVNFATGPDRFVIGDPCSSVHNISLAIVLWTTAAMVFKIRIDRRYAMTGLAMVAFMFGLNVARLSILGLFPEHFDILHTGAGALLFGWAGLIGAAILAGIGVVNAAARQH